MHKSVPRGLLVLVSLLALACRAPAAAQKEQPRRSACGGKTVFALVDVNVIAMGTAHVWPHHTVAWCGDTIVDVAPRAELNLPPDTTILEAPGAYVMPGLADMHTHLIRPQDLTLYVTHGVTTVRNMWGAPVHLEWRRQIKAGTRVGPRIFTAGPIVDGPHPVHQGSLPLSNAAQAAAVVKFHQAQGYDFIKIYSGLEAEPFGALMEHANAAGIKVVGHIPRAVGLEAAVKAGLHGVEHQDGSLEFLQAEDSPVKGKWDRASRANKILHVDESRIPALSALLKNVQSCPTRVVKDGFGPSALAREKLASPAARYVPACERAIWEPTTDLPPEAAVAYQKQVDLEEKIIRALRDTRAPLLAGTDTANPLVIPGYSVHEELAHLVRSGLTPFEALYSATRAASDAVGLLDQFGSIHPGGAADLVLLGGNPLEAIHQTRNILGVVVGGRHLDAQALTALGRTWPPHSPRRRRCLRSRRRGRSLLRGCLRPPTPFPGRMRPLEQNASGWGRTTHSMHRPLTRTPGKQ